MQPLMLIYQEHSFLYSNSPHLTTSPTITTTISHTTSLPTLVSHGSASPSPPPSEIAQFKAFLNAFKNQNRTTADAAVLRHCLGLERLPNAPPLANHIIVIAFDIESCERYPRPLTEIGLVTWESKHMRNIVGDAGLGPFGENLSKQMYFYHARIQPTAHLVKSYCVSTLTLSCSAPLNIDH